MSESVNRSRAQKNSGISTGSTVIALFQRVREERRKEDHGMCVINATSRRQRGCSQRKQRHPFEPVEKLQLSAPSVFETAVQRSGRNRTSSATYAQYHRMTWVMSSGSLQYSHVQSASSPLVGLKWIVQPLTMGTRRRSVVRGLEVGRSRASCANPLDCH